MAFGHCVLEGGHAVGLLELHLAYFAVRWVFGVDVGPEFDPHPATVVVEIPECGGIVCDCGIRSAVVFIAVVIEMSSSVGEVKFGLCVRGTCIVVVILADYGLIYGSRAWTIRVSLVVASRRRSENSTGGAAAGRSRI